jgi:hypothetical protein
MLQGSTGFNYVVQASSNLVSWQPITNFVATTSPFYFTDAQAASSGKRFYRAVIQ